MTLKRLGALLLLLVLGGAAWLLWRRSPVTIEHATGGTDGRTARNVLLVTIDTLRADAVGVYGGRHVTTPALD
ncbi:MAG: hypothetical protein ACM36C_02610, partial [Acidobacteriota bacterium]